jgi:DNA-directed RNA polymerase subunit E'/Rpb7
MFVLTTLRDVVGVPPVCFIPEPAEIASGEGSSSLPAQRQTFAPTIQGNTFMLIARHQLSLKYVGKVVAGKGYCVSIATVRQCSEAAILHNGEGSAWISVSFDVVLFRPFVGEKIRAKIHRQTPQGIKLTLGFFSEVFVPAASLQSGSKFDTEQEAWYIEVDEEEDAPSGQQQRQQQRKEDEADADENEFGDFPPSQSPGRAASTIPPTSSVSRNYYINGDEVLWNVEKVKVSTGDGGGSTAGAGKGFGVPQESSLDSAIQSFTLNGKTPIMYIMGSMLGLGLGPVHWYKD